MYFILERVCWNGRQRASFGGGGGEGEGRGGQSVWKRGKFWSSRPRCPRWPSRWSSRWPWRWMGLACCRCLLCLHLHPGWHWIQVASSPTTPTNPSFGISTILLLIINMELIMNSWNLAHLRLRMLMKGPQYWAYLAAYNQSGIMHLLTSQFWDVDEAAERGSQRGQLWNCLSEKTIYHNILLL